MPAWIMWMLVDFERLDEARRQAERDHVAAPRSLAPAGGEGETREGRRAARLPGCASRTAFRVVVADVRAGINVAVPHPVLQRNAPLPAAS